MYPADPVWGISHIFVSVCEKVRINAVIMVLPIGFNGGFLFSICEKNAILRFV